MSTTGRAGQNNRTRRKRQVWKARWFRAGAEDGRVGKSKPNNTEREGSAAQRSAEQSTEQLASGQKPMCRRYPCCMHSTWVCTWFRFVGGVC